MGIETTLVQKRRVGRWRRSPPGWPTRPAGTLLRRRHRDRTYVTVRKESAPRRAYDNRLAAPV